MSERTRAHIYRIGLAVIGLLVVYGVVSENEAAQWAILAAALVGLGTDGLASKHTSTRKRDP